jgi:hypothetical protein
MNVLEKATHIGLIAVSVVAVGVLLHRTWLDHGVTVGHPKSATLVGKAVRPPGVDLGRTSFSVLIAFSPHCQFCRRSAPLYRKLVTWSEENRSRANVVLLAPAAESEIATQRFVNDNSLQGAPISAVSFASLSIRGTPTLLVVNPSGLVKAAFVGMLSDADEKQLHSVLRNECSKCTEL